MKIFEQKTNRAGKRKKKILFSVVDKSSREKNNKAIVAPNSIISEIDLLDMQGIFRSLASWLQILRKVNWDIYEVKQYSKI